jgi:hypothetical protein
LRGSFRAGTSDAGVVEDEFGGVAGGAGGLGSVVHVAGGDGTVVEQDQLLG